MNSISIIDKNKLFVDLLRIQIEDASSDYFVKEVFHNYRSLEKLLKKPTNVIIVDCEVTDVLHITQLKKLMKNDFGSKVIFFNFQNDPKSVRRALKLGASGYLNKSCSIDEFKTCLEKVVNGEVYVDSSIRWTDFNGVNDEDISSFEKLTAREMEVVEYLSQGYTNILIAEQLFISSQTVAVHRKNILRKFNAKNVAHLVRLYCEEVK